MGSYVLAIDQGTTGTTALLIDADSFSKFFSA
jgi:sugar (pentulose or hexulose) kinase